MNHIDELKVLKWDLKLYLYVGHVDGYKITFLESPFFIRIIDAEAILWSIIWPYLSITARIEF